MSTIVEKCENCGRVIGALETPNIHDGHVVCAEGKQRLTVPAQAAPVIPSTSRSTSQCAAISGIPTCQTCGGAMKKDKRSHGNLVGIVAALIIFCIGIAIFLLIPCFGWVIGPIVCILSLFMGGKREMIWKCTSCGAYIPRT